MLVKLKWFLHFKSGKIVRIILNINKNLCCYAMLKSILVGEIVQELNIAYKTVFIY